MGHQCLAEHQAGGVDHGQTQEAAVKSAKEEGTDSALQDAQANQGCARKSNEANG
jgi:hypothetical protein